MESEAESIESFFRYYSRKYNIAKAAVWAAFIASVRDIKLD